jgi:hypothetical protein
MDNIYSLLYSSAGYSPGTSLVILLCPALALLPQCSVLLSASGQVRVQHALLRRHSLQASLFSHFGFAHGETCTFTFYSSY